MQQLKQDSCDPELKNKLRFEALFDRMMYRLEGMSPLAEAWHRDVMPSNLIKHKDEIFGGWINLDSEDQYFSCIPGSHLGIRQSEIPSGFDSLENHIKRHMDTTPNGTELKKLVKEFGLSKLASKTRIPPGHLVIFPQYIMHEIVANKATHNMMRLFTGWRLTISSVPLRTINNTKYNENIIDDQAVSPLPGGMFPPMYSASHQTYMMNKPFTVGDKKTTVTDWSHKSFKPSILIKKKMTDAQKKNAITYPQYYNSGTDYMEIVERYMHSLKYYNNIDDSIKMYPEYSSSERSIMRPNKL